jgi:hypothetical protein
MEDPEGQIPAAAQLWDEVLKLREEQNQFREDFEEHRLRVRDRHQAFGEQLGLVVQAAEKNTHAREDFEDEIKQLHVIMRQWYHTIIDLQKMVLLIAEHLEVDRGILTLNPPLPLKSRERAA